MLLYLIWALPDAGPGTAEDVYCALSPGSGVGGPHGEVPVPIFVEVAEVGQGEAEPTLARLPVADVPFPELVLKVKSLLELLKILKANLYLLKSEQLFRNIPCEN